MENAEATEQKKEDITSYDYWKKWIRAASKNKHRRSYIARSKKAWAEYLMAESGDGDVDARTFPSYWNACKTLEPACFSKAPNLLISKRFDFSDTVGDTMVFIAERVGKHLLEASDFCPTMRAAVQDLINTDRATTQVVYKREMRIKTQLTRVSPVDFEDGSTGWYDDAADRIVEGEPLEGVDGFYIEETVEQEVPVVNLLPARYDEILHTPEARTTADINELAFRFCIAKELAVKVFGRDICEGITFKPKREADEEEELRQSRGGEEETGSLYIEGWEIWRKHDRTIFFVPDEGQGDKVLKAHKEREYRLRKFFPAPDFIFGTKPDKHMFPTPVYSRLKVTYDKLHAKYSQVHELIEKVKRKALVHGGAEELVELLNDSENDYITVEGLEGILEKIQSMEHLVWFLPVRELVSAISELKALIEWFDDQVNLWFGVPDILRGISDPIETAGAQEIKSSAAHDRFAWMKAQVAELARSSIEMMIDVALNVFSDEQIAEIVGIRFASKAHQDSFSAALQHLRDDEQRLIRIDIETDSTSLRDELKKREERDAANTTILQGLERIAAMGATGGKPYMEAGFKILAATVAEMPVGKQFSDTIREAVKGLTESQAADAGKEPPPDYKMMTAQARLQEVELKRMVAQRDLDRKDFEAQLKAASIRADQELERYKAMVDERIQTILVSLEGAGLEVKKAATSAQISESAREEDRLAAETMLAAAKPSKPESPTPPPPAPTVVINNATEKPLLPPFRV